MSRKSKEEERRPSEISDWEGNQDAFYKKIFLGSPLLRGMIADRLGWRAEELADMDPHTTEFQSRAVSDAFHGQNPWKGLRSDGIYKSAGGFALGIEFQSTPNHGMPIRVQVYKTAYLEEHPDFPSEDLKFVVVYSGSGRGVAGDRHGEVRREEIEYLYIDLNKIPAEKLEADGPYGFVMRLTRPDAIDIGQFHLAEDMIKSADISELEQNNLFTALVVAASNKPRVFAEVLERFQMNNAVRRSLVEALPRLRTMAEGQMMRDRLSSTAVRREWPDEVLTLIEYVHDDDLDDLDDRIRNAEKSEDWTDLIEQAHEFASAGPGFR